MTALSSTAAACSSCAKHVQFDGGCRIAQRPVCEVGKIVEHHAVVRAALQSSLIQLMCLVGILEYFFLQHGVRVQRERVIGFGLVRCWQALAVITTSS